MPEARLPVTGGCMCGALRYEATAPPWQAFYCHCDTCRRAYGLYMASVQFHGPDFRFTAAEPTYFRSSAFARRGFCGACGTPICFLYDGNPEIWVITGSLDHPEDWPMTKGADWGRTFHVFVEHKLPWLELADGLPQLPGTAVASKTAAENFAAFREPD
jgi:hypothetical protein